MIQHPAGSADNDLGATTQAFDLRVKVLATVNWQNVELAELAGIGSKSFSHLDGQLPRWCQHQNLGLGNGRVDSTQQRQGKSRSFTGTSLGNTQ